MRAYMNILNESASSGSDKINEARIDETIEDFRSLVMEFNKPCVELTEFNKAVKKFTKKHPGMVAALAGALGLGAYNAATNGGDTGGYEQGGYDDSGFVDPEASSQGLRNRIDNWLADTSSDRDGDDYGPFESEEPAPKRR